MNYSKIEIVNGQVIVHPNDQGDYLIQGNIEVKGGGVVLKSFSEGQAAKVYGFAPR